MRYGHPSIDVGWALARLHDALPAIGAERSIRMAG
jgi:hypothetical protein